MTLLDRSFLALAALVSLTCAAAAPAAAFAPTPGVPAPEVLVRVLSIGPDGVPGRVRLEFPPVPGDETAGRPLVVDIDAGELATIRTAIEELHRSTGPDGRERVLFRVTEALRAPCGGPVRAAGPFEVIAGTDGSVLLRDLGRDTAVTFRLVRGEPELRPEFWTSILQYYLCLRAHVAFQEQCFEDCKETCGDDGVRSVRSSDFCGRRGRCECTCRSGDGSGDDSGAGPGKVGR